MSFSSSSSSSSSSGPSIAVHENQRGNPVLANIRQIPWAFAKDMVADYVMGTTCALFLSLKYHMLHPKYIERRIFDTGKGHKTRVLLAFVDDLHNTKALLDLNRLCFLTEFTLILTWSYEECARYIETFRYYEDKPLTAIQEKVETEYLPKVTKVLTSVKPVNRTDVITLLENFNSLRHVCTADEASLQMCPGFGGKKAKKLYQVLHEPFLKRKRDHDQEPTKPLQQQQQQHDANIEHMEPEIIEL